MGEDTLPSGWTWTTLEEIALALNPGFPSGKHNKNQQGVPHLRPMNISAQGSVDFSEVKYVEVSDYDPLLKDDVLFNNTNSPALVGKTSYIRQDTRWAYSNHMTRIRFYSGTVNSAFIAYYLHHLFLSGFFRLHCTHHVNQASINTSFLSKVSIPFPPLPEQHRIVAEIEKQLTRLDAGVAALRRAQANLRRYKASVLKAACGGHLVPQDPADEPASVLLRRILAERRARWEADQVTKGKDPKKLKYPEPAAPDTSELPELPEGWVWASLEAISDALGGYAFKSRDYTEDGFQIVKIGNVDRSRLDLSRRPSFIKHVDEKITERYLLGQGDIIITLTGTRKKRDYGFVAMVNNEQNLLLNQRVARLRFHPSLDAEYFLIALQGKNFQDRFFQYETGNVGQGNVGMRAITVEPIALPPIAEQQRIVAEVERRLSVVEELEAALTANLKRAERLRQAVLKRAFEGRLVPQDLNDEPAAALLERIQAGRQERPRPVQARQKPARQGKRGREKGSGTQLRLL